MAKIDTWLSKQLPNIMNNLEVVKKTDFLHISNNSNITKMNPRIGERQMKIEDRTIPRICGCDSLLGCVFGHSGVRENPGEFFTVYRISGVGVCRPSRDLVPDAHISRELWIPAYGPEALEVYPEKIGSFIVHEVKNVITDGKVDVMDTVLYVKVDSDFMLTNNIAGKGLYSIYIPNSTLKAASYMGKGETPAFAESVINPLNYAVWAEAVKGYNNKKR